MKKTSLTLTLGLGLGLVLTACASERSIDSYNEGVEIFDESDYESYGNIAAQDAYIFGDIGQMKNLDNPATVSGYDDGDYTTIEVIAEDNRGAAMHWLEIYGGVNHPALRAGNELSFVGGNYPEQEGAIHVEAMTCQGPAPYAWDIDDAASRTDVTVREVEGRPDLLEIEYVTFVNEQSGLIGNETVSSGTFTLQR